MRCAMVASGTRKARAISPVVRPPTARSVSASWDAGVSSGWQQRNSSISVSSWPETGPSSCVAAAGAPGPAGSGGSASAAAVSRRRRASSLRSWSVSRRDATVMSQLFG